jgi:hypothetical protein
MAPKTPAKGDEAVDLPNPLLLFFLKESSESEREIKASEHYTFFGLSGPKNM